MLNNKIAIVLVTFNRLDKLKIALECYENQSYPLREMIVVDNCSTDGTDKFLNRWRDQKGKFERKVLTLTENTGGAGGFGAGMDYLLDEVKNGKSSADWIMVSDDDAFPTPDAIDKLISYYGGLCEKEQKKIAVLSSKVLNHGTPHLAHRSRVKRNALRVQFVGVSESEYSKDAFELDLFSYVGSMIKIVALQQVGTTRRDLFIYGDDNEHSLRLKTYGKLICVPASVYNHDTPGVETRKVGWHNYYNRRNQLFILKKYFPKRYLVVRIAKRYILDISVISKYNREEKKLFKIAQDDAMAERLGRHPIYKPGFQIRGG